MKSLESKTNAKDSLKFMVNIRLHVVMTGQSQAPLKPLPGLTNPIAVIFSERHIIFQIS